MFHVYYNLSYIRYSDYQVRIKFEVFILDLQYVAKQDSANLSFNNRWNNIAIMFPVHPRRYI